MKHEWRKYLERNVPRYTSYPSALHFEDCVGAEQFDKALQRVGPYEPVSIYTHVPYCKSLCWYCGCNMKVENDYSRTEAFLEALLMEIRLVASKLGGRGKTTQIHFGGGTPNFMRSDDLRRIINEIELCFGVTDDTPIAMELDPRLCHLDQIMELIEMGVTRMSLGVQDFNLDVQQAINRIQSFNMIENCVAAMRHAGVNDISFDLVYGLPKQTLEGFERTLTQTINLSPERVSLFGYAHLPNKILHQKLIQSADLPSRETRLAFAEMADEMLTVVGYDRIGFDHFARKDTAIAKAAREGHLNRNFQGFTEDPAETVLGLGPSAISSVNGSIFQNAKHIPCYYQEIMCGRLATAKGITTTYSDQAIGHWIKGLLCQRKASLRKYFDDPCAASVPEMDVLAALEELIHDEIVTLDGDEIKIHEDARALSRVVAAVFDPALQKDTSAMSQAV
jgi:oxygen-independent coproporphyrinogen-3 oxidase